MLSSFFSRKKYFRIGLKTRQCRCLMEVPSPVTPCSRYELSVPQSSVNDAIASEEVPDDIFDLTEVTIAVDDEPAAELEYASGDVEEPTVVALVEETADDETEAM